MEILWLDDARDDLRDIRRFLQTRAGSNVARRIGAHIVQAVNALAEMPNRGRPGRWSGTRELVITGMPYIAPYRVRGDTIEILHVFHGAQQWPEAPDAAEDEC
jgi:addiction module RelE/StbE family toxin